MSLPIPRPPGIPLLGNVFDVNTSNTWTSLASLAAKYGEIFQLTVLGKTVVFVAGASLAEELCDQRRFRKYVGGPVVEIRHAVHDALFTAYDDEASWGVAHRICAPLLRREAVEGWTGEVAVLTGELVRWWCEEEEGGKKKKMMKKKKKKKKKNRSKEERDGKKVDEQGEGEGEGGGDDHQHQHHPDSTKTQQQQQQQQQEDGVLLMTGLNRLSLEATTATLFGRKLGCIAAAHDDPMLAAMEDATSEAMRRPTRPGLVNWLFHSRRWRESKTAMREGYAAPVITHRRRNPTSRRDLLGALLKGRDPDTGEALRESQIVDEVVTMPIGSSTAPCALASALYFLCKNRECFVKARKEVDEVLGPWVGGAGGGEENTDDDEEDDEEEEEEEDVQMTAEQLGRLSYIEGVVRETLRLSAAAPGFNIEPIPRTTAAGDVDTAPVLLGGGKYAVTHDQAMIIVLAGVNTDPSVFDDPLSFRPERMMREALEALPAGVKKWFGNGRRECIGKNWAWMFMVTVLAVLVRRCDFEMVDEEGWTWKQDGWFNIRPVGLRMKVTRRKAATAAAA